MLASMADITQILFSRLRSISTPFADRNFALPGMPSGDTPNAFRHLQIVVTPHPNQ
jgi:hypothetical protein